MATQINRKTGFTLVELLVVMTIVGLLLSMVGPLAISSLEKAQAKQELLSIKHWLSKLSARSYYSATEHYLVFNGHGVNLFLMNKNEPIIKQKFKYLFFQPQQLFFNSKGMIRETFLRGEYRDKSFNLIVKVGQDGGISSQYIHEIPEVK
jgi:prepilin-type N-terminal cleavage/methylation domain-containing protein